MEYREVDREAKVGERIRIASAKGEWKGIKNGGELVVKGKDYGGRIYLKHPLYGSERICREDYVVLEPIDDELSAKTADERKVLAAKLRAEADALDASWKPWEPEKGERYFKIESLYYGLATLGQTCGSCCDKYPYSFRTEQAAQSALPDIKLAIRVAQWREDHPKAVVVEGDWWVSYTHIAEEWIVERHSTISDLIGPFACIQFAQQFITDNTDFLESYARNKGWMT